MRASERVRALLPERDGSGRIPYGVYCKWYGAHWVLAALADIGYPPGDENLIPLREQDHERLLGERHLSSVLTIEGLPWRCASQEGNLLWSLLMLGLDDERCDRLVDNLLKWQWPDGGWHRDKKPQARVSSFHKTLIPLRALALYSRQRGDQRTGAAARRAAEVFLQGGLLWRKRDGAIMDGRFMLLHYPGYWRYNLLAGLKMMAEAGFIGDERCREALDVLQAKRPADGGFPAEDKLYRMTSKTSPTGSGASRVSWGGASKRRMNEWVTVDALHVLAQAGRPLGL